MAAGDFLITRIDELLALFNRRGLDLPDGLFDRQTQFLLNGTPFEAMLGRDPRDPLVLMIARGPAGFRFAVKALQHAVPDARVERGAIEAGGSPGACLVPLWLSGHLRGTDEPIEAVVCVSVAWTERGVVSRADAAIDAAELTRLREARLRD
jgi:hypothetical protein